MRRRLNSPTDLGMPLNEALIFVNNCLRGIGVRDKIRVICSGKVSTGFDMVEKFALGADMCNAARAMMFAVGCIQALHCNTNRCPSGVATQDPIRGRAVNVPQKRQRVHRFHDATLGKLPRDIRARWAKRRWPTFDL